MASGHGTIIFDLDGTISDPLEGIGRSINDSLAHFGFPERELLELSTFIGPPLDEAFASLTGLAAKSDLAMMVAKYRERYADIGYAENVLYDGMFNVLVQMRDAGISLGICTSKRHDFAVRIVELFGLSGFFRFVSGGDVGIQKSQQIAALLSEGTVDKSAVMVGDRALDIAAAHRNGLLGAGVLWGYGSREELADEDPEFLFATPGEILVLAGIAL